MSRAALIRAGGMAAIVGGVLRGAASFAPAVGSDIERQLLYLVVDMFLLFGAAFAGLGREVWSAARRL